MSQESFPGQPQQIKSEVDGQNETGDDTSGLPYPDLPAGHYKNWSKKEVQDAHAETRELGGAHGELGGLPVSEAAEVEEE